MSKQPYSEVYVTVKGRTVCFTNPGHVRLIAAAPGLLEALKAIEKEIDLDRIRDIAKQAIARAEGK